MYKLSGLWRVHDLGDFDGRCIYTKVGVPADSPDLNDFIDYDLVPVGMCMYKLSGSWRVMIWVTLMVGVFTQKLACLQVAWTADSPDLNDFTDYLVPVGMCMHKLSGSWRVMIWVTLMAGAFVKKGWRACRLSVPQIFLI